MQGLDYGKNSPIPHGFQLHTATQAAGTGAPARFEAAGARPAQSDRCGLTSIHSFSSTPRTETSGRSTGRSDCVDNSCHPGGNRRCTQNFVAQGAAQVVRRDLGRGAGGIRLPRPPGKPPNAGRGCGSGVFRPCRPTDHKQEIGLKQNEKGLSRRSVSRLEPTPEAVNLKLKLIHGILRFNRDE
jgi:hypothetical protein